jgi:hypothetical protein
MNASAIIAIVGGAIALVVQVLAVGMWVGGIKARLSNQDEKLDNLEARAERTESLLSGLAQKVEVRFHTEAAAKPKRRRR